MPGYPCCCAPKPTIPCCAEGQQPPAEILVDLGAGGWTDQDCGFCDEVAGIVSVTRVADRDNKSYPAIGPVPTWEFKIADVCTQDGHDLAFVVVLQINCSDEPVIDPPPDTTIGIYLTEGTDERDFNTTPNIGYFAIYGADLGSETWDCRFATAETYTKSLESPAPFVSCCDGSLPGTITAEAP